MGTTHDLCHTRRRSTLVLTLAAAAVGASLVGGAASASAQEPTAPSGAASASPSSSPTIDLADPARAEVDRQIELRGTASAGGGSATIVVERLDGTTWRELGRPLLAANGTFVQSVVTPLGATTIRARLVVDGADAATDQTTLTGIPAGISARLSSPSSAKDYSVVRAGITVKRTHDGARLSRRGVVQFRRKGERTWRTVSTWRTSQGSATVSLRPHFDGSYRLSIPATGRSTSLVTAARGFRLRPPGTVITLPKGAPRPTVHLPAQTRPDKPGADVRIEGVGPKTWSSMVGRTWHRGCPVGRDRLRVVRTSYWAYDGYVRRGEIVVNVEVARDVAGIFADLYKNRTPIRSIYREDRFGWHRGLQGANDYRSMSAGNTSGFNCRRVVGSPGLISPHSYGTAIDINTWENPFRSAAGYFPNSWWATRSTPASITWRGYGDPVVKIFARHGYHWLGTADLQHFQR